MTPQPRPARPEGFIPPLGPLAQCQDCGNFPVPIGSPVAELIDTLQDLLDDAAEALRQYHDEDDYTEKKLLARIDRFVARPAADLGMPDLLGGASPDTFRRHQPDRGSKRCLLCKEPWPCGTQRMNEDRWRDGSA